MTARSKRAGSAITESLTSGKELHGDQYIEYSDGYLEIDDDFLDQVNGIYSSLYQETGKLLYGENPSVRAGMEIPFSDGIVKKVRLFLP